MKPDDFEKTLQRQPFRQIPTEWRAEILQAARSTSDRLPTFEPRASWLSTLKQRLAAALWPHPQAWAGLAAVWILIFALHFASRDRSPAIARVTAVPSSRLVIALREQNKLLVELIGRREVKEADRPRPSAPQPRSQRRELFLTG